MAHRTEGNWSLGGSHGLVTEASRGKLTQTLTPSQTARSLLCSKSCCQISLRFVPITGHLISSSVTQSGSLMSRVLPAETAAKVMTEYHPAHKARTFNRAAWDQGIPDQAVPISLNCIHYKSHQLDKLSNKLSQQGLTKFGHFAVQNNN